MIMFGIQKHLEVEVETRTVTFIAWNHLIKFNLKDFI